MKKAVCLCAVIVSAMVLCGCNSNRKVDNAAITNEPNPDKTQKENEMQIDNESIIAEDEEKKGTNMNNSVNGTNETNEVVQYPGYTLLWNDEFDGDSLNTDNWKYELHAPGWTNSELQEYTDSKDNIFVKDGMLVLKALKHVNEKGEVSYTSGKINSHYKRDFLYGKVTARVKVPEGKGLWPAVWMMPKTETVYGQWPKCGEIDIMETLGNQPQIAYGTIHYGSPHAEQQGTYVLESGTFASDFHEFSVEWEPGEIRFLIDGELYKTVNDWFTASVGGEEKPYPAPFDQEFYVQLNLAVGGNWPGAPDENTNFETAEFKVDYVRVYQKPYYDTNVKKAEKVYREPLADGNYIYNGEFNENESLDDDVNWKFLLTQNGDAAAEIKDNMIVIKTKAAGDVDYSVQLVQPELPCITGKKYKISFDAYADEERDMIVCVSAPTAGWIRYLNDTIVDLTTEKMTYTYEFEMKNKDDANGRIEFNLGKRDSTATIYITNVRMEEIN